MPKKILYRDGKQLTIDSQLNNMRKWGLGQSLIERISQASVNKLDKNEWQIKGISKQTRDLIKKTLKQSHIKKLKKRVGHHLSQEGTSAIAIQIGNNEAFLKEYRVIQKETMFYELTSIVLANYEPLTISIEDVLYDQSLHFYFDEKGRVVKETLNTPHDKTKDIIITDQFVYPKSVTRIPVEVIYNNERGLSDIGNVKMWDAIAELDYHAKEFGVEWMVSRTLWLDNHNFGDGQLRKWIEDDNRVIPVESYKSKMQEPITMASAGTPTVTQAMVDINFIEQKILKYTFSNVDTISTGTNKFNKEIDKFNQDANEYLENKRESREESYSFLISKLIEILFALRKKVKYEDKDKVFVKLKLSDLEQAIIDEAALRAKTMEAEGKKKLGEAAEQQARALKHQADVKTIKEGE